MAELQSRVEIVEGDLFDDQALDDLVRGVDAVIHLVGIIAERPRQGQTFDRIHHQATARLVERASAAGVGRWIQMSALGARPDATADYHRTKWLGEQAVRHSDMAWTIFRPSVIHGPRGEFVRMVKQWVTSAWNPPFIPYFGAGLFGTQGGGMLQPVWVEDVAQVFVQALEEPLAAGEIYPLGGAEAYTWPDMFRIFQRLIPGARPNKRIVAIPAWYASLIAGMPGVPFNRDQVIMSQEDSTCDRGKVENDFKLEMASLPDTLEAYAQRIG